MDELAKNSLKDIIVNGKVTDVSLSVFTPDILKRRKKNELLVQPGKEVTAIIILLEGRCCIEKYGPQGNLMIDMQIVPVQYFGLFEAIGGVPWHTAAIRCLTDCTYLMIPSQTYIECMRTDTEWMWHSLCYLSDFIYRTLEQNEELMMNDARSNILRWLYRYGEKNDFPQVVNVKKEDLARELNIHLRTLYRKLDGLYGEGLISARHGKIQITRDQYGWIYNTLFR